MNCSGVLHYENGIISNCTFVYIMLMLYNKIAALFKTCMCSLVQLLLVCDIIAVKLKVLGVKCQI